MSLFSSSFWGRLIFSFVHNFWGFIGLLTHWLSFSFNLDLFLSLRFLLFFGFFFLFDKFGFHFSFGLLFFRFNLSRFVFCLFSVSWSGFWHWFYDRLNRSRSGLRDWSNYWFSGSWNSFRYCFDNRNLLGFIFLLYKSFFFLRILYFLLLFYFLLILLFLALLGILNSNLTFLFPISFSIFLFIICISISFSILLSFILPLITSLISISSIFFILLPILMRSIILLLTRLIILPLSFATLRLSCALDNWIERSVRVASSRKL